ncbi:hypothetical protein [Hydrocarboniphaga sp.]|uniref:hypothetical protein n=1 Tax=Hydrocarboniphaga sp. TaxID=2033016 RepID=UPI002ABAF171|nr:hypothetical protein [Hydrocarboniphaga sp.]MDZ4078482.1 hypothetical protein [Hydrocarboniphaga sp.]
MRFSRNAAIASFDSSDFSCAVKASDSHCICPAISTDGRRNSSRVHRKPRTGITTLHRVLAMDLQFQGLEYWLIDNPMPRPPREAWAANPLFKRAVDELDALSRSAGDEGSESDHRRRGVRMPAAHAAGFSLDRLDHQREHSELPAMVARPGHRDDVASLSRQPAADRPARA